VRPLPSSHRCIVAKSFVVSLLQTEQDLFRLWRCPQKRRPIDERDKVVERLREFIRFGYVTGSEVARRIGIHDTLVYSWLNGEFRPENPKRITAFLDSLAAESGSGIAPVGYEYREYKNWRGIPKPRCCPFCKEAKGEVRKGQGRVPRLLSELGSNGAEQGKS
jgi:hypothetical protein